MWTHIHVTHFVLFGAGSLYSNECFGELFPSFQAVPLIPTSTRVYIYFSFKYIHFPEHVMKA
jgi:hypothetical protein